MADGTEQDDAQAKAVSLTPEQEQVAAAVAARFPHLADAVRARADGWLEITVPAADLVELGRFLRDSEALAFDFLSCISAVDAQEKGFEVVYHLLSLLAGRQVVLKVPLPDRENPVVPSVVSLWPTADWHEREAWDLMGIRFEGHPDLRRILMREDWVGHPLRKDYVDQRPSREAQRKANQEKARSRF